MFARQLRRPGAVPQAEPATQQERKMTKYLQDLTNAVAGMSVLQATLFWLFIGIAFVAIRRIYARLVHHKSAPAAPAQHHNIAFLLALASVFALCLSFPFHIVLADDQFDWISACVVLYGTCWVAIGAVMSREQEVDMLSLIDTQKGATPNAIEVATVKALVDASRFCRNGLIFVALGAVIQMGHLVYKAHPELFFKVAVAQADPAMGATITQTPALAALRDSQPS